jgi:hypothetical protein
MVVRRRLLVVMLLMVLLVVRNAAHAERLMRIDLVDVADVIEVRRMVDEPHPVRVSRVHRMRRHAVVSEHALEAIVGALTPLVEVQRAEALRSARKMTVVGVVMMGRAVMMMRRRRRGGRV